MSLVNDYLKRLGHKSKAPSGREKGGIPPVLQRKQKGSVHTAARKKYLFFAGTVVVMYGVGYFMVSSATLSKQPVDNAGVTVETESARMKSTASTPTVTQGGTREVTAVQALPVQQLSDRSDTGKGTAALKVVPVQNKLIASNRIEQEEKTIAEVNGKGDVTATDYSQPDRLAETQEPETGLSGIREEPYPLADTWQGTARATTSANYAQTSAKRVFFTESKITPAYNYQIALQAQHNNKYGRAERFYRNVLRQEPGHENALVNLAAIYIQEKRLQEARSLIDKVIEMNPENPKALVNAGMIELQQNNEKAAANYFHQALKYNPIEETALINLAYLAQQEKKYDEAGAYYEKLVRVSPENTNILLAYAGLEEQKKRYISAINLYRRCLDLLSMQKHPRRYERIQERIQVLRQYAVQQENKEFYEVK